MDLIQVLTLNNLLTVAFAGVAFYYISSKITRRIGSDVHRIRKPVRFSRCHMDEN